MGPGVRSATSSSEACFGGAGPFPHPKAEASANGRAARIGLAVLKSPLYLRPIRRSPGSYDYAVSIDTASRARVLEFVKPLSVGLDGMTNFGFVERRLGVVEHLLDLSRRLD